MVGYLSKFCFAELCILIDEPNFSDIEVAEYDWSKSIYGNASEAFLETTNQSSTAPLSHTPSCIRDTMLYPFIMFARPLHLDTLC
jgi:hypothetical protein